MRQCQLFQALFKKVSWHRTSALFQRRNHLDMEAKRNKCLLAVFLCSGLLLSLCEELASHGLALPIQRKTSTTHDKHPVAVADVIGMTQFADPGYIRGLSAKHIVAQFSPNGQRFVVLLKKGNLELSTNDYYLVLFRTADVFHSTASQMLVSLSSSSNRPGIQKVIWLDNDSIAFLGEHVGEPQELYEFKVSSKELKRLTNHPTSLTSYAMSANGVVLFTAEPPRETFLTKDTRQAGIVVSTQPLPDLIVGENRFKHMAERELFSKRSDSETETQLQTEDLILGPGELWLSPNGRYLIVRTSVKDPPDIWQEYDDRFLQTLIREKHSKGAASFVFRYTLIDLNTGKDQPLLEAPIASSGLSEVVWLPNSRSVLVTGTYLPLDIAEPVKRKVRRSGTFVAEIKIPSREITPISQKEARFVRWNSRTDTVLLRSALGWSTVDLEGAMLAYRRTETGWKEVEATEAGPGTNARPEVTLEEDLNTPPRIVVGNPATGQSVELLDLNPQFGELEFGRVEEITFEATDGHAAKGGLYYPPDYLPGKRYPLVIQTHGWNPQRFWIDGPYSTAFAAQPLAGKGFVVLQLEEDLNQMSTPREAHREMSAYEGAIEHLDKMGLIDRARVGLIGFSRTGLAIEYTLTHSTYQFAAATIADGNDAGYFQYIAFLNAFPNAASDSEGINEGRPFGDGLRLWLERSPGFHLDKVQTPLHIEVLEPGALLSSWEWFSGLTRLGRPVEMVYMPDAAHVLVKPWERMTSQQGSVDWFGFWLKGEEDPDPSKAEQYARWREMRKLQEENEKKSAPLAN